MRNGSTISKAHPTAQAALSAYHALPNKDNVKIHHVKESLKSIKKSAKKLSEDGAAAVSVGSGAVAGITDPTTNYAFQAEKKKKNLKQVKSDMVKRKKPMGEELSAGIGNTQIPAGTKKEKGLKGKKTAVAPSTQNGSGDVGNPIGGQ